MSKIPLQTEFPFSLCPVFCWKYFFLKRQLSIFFLEDALGFHLVSKQGCKKKNKEERKSIVLKMIS